MVLVLERMNEDLFDVMRSWRPLQTTANIMKELLIGMIELKKHNITHRDLKPENIFVSKKKKKRVTDDEKQKGKEKEEEEEEEQYVVKIADFEAWQQGAVIDHDILNHCGTPFFRSPEYLLGAPPSSCDTREDMWGAGWTFSNLLGIAPFDKLPQHYKPNDAIFPKEELGILFDYMQLPIPTDSKKREEFFVWSTFLTQEIVQQKFSWISPHKDFRFLDAVTRDLLEGMLQPNPLFRLSPEQALLHPFFSFHTEPTPLQNLISSLLK